MKTLRIQFPNAELELLQEATSRFNQFSAYLDDIKITTYQNHQVLSVPLAESAMFVESFIDDFPKFSKERIRKDLVGCLKEVLKDDPTNLPAQHSLEALKAFVL